MAKVIKYQLTTEVPYTVTVEVPLLDEEGNSVLREIKTPVTEEVTIPVLDDMGEPLMDENGEAVVSVITQPVFDENGEMVYDITYEAVTVEETRQEVRLVFTDVSIICATREIFDANYPIAEKEAVGEIIVEGAFDYAVAPRNIFSGEYVTIQGVLYLATENIPNGEPVIAGQNAIETTLEQQLYELKGE